MSSHTIAFFIFLLCFLFSAVKTNAADVSLDLPAALGYALRENPQLKSKRHALGAAQGRAQQASLLFQNNPRFGVETESPTTGSGTAVELNLLQELEIAGQGGHR